MTALARRLRRTGSGDAGFTLAELLVTIILSMLIMALVTGLVQTSRGVLVTERARTNDLGVAFPAIDQVQRSVRAAVPPTSGGAAVAAADSTSVTYYTLNYTEPTPLPSGGVAPAPEALAAAQPRKVTLAVSGGRLSMTTVPPVQNAATGAWTYSGGSTTRVLATGVANTAAEPVFEYRYDTGSPIAGSLLAETTRKNVAYLRLRLLLDTNNGEGRPVEVVDTIRLANYGTES